jgi:hypothetical protein
MSFLTSIAQIGQYDSSLYDDSSYYSTSSQLTEGQALAITGGMVVFFLIVAVVAYVVNAFLLSRIFKKAGVESWKAWVPVYNSWILLELGGQHGFWAILMLIPFVNIVAVVFLIIAQYHIGLKLGKSGAFVLLAIFLPLVWLIWLAVDDSKWNGAPAVAGATPQPGQPTAPVAPIAPNVQTPPSNDNQQTPPPTV